MLDFRHPLMYSVYIALFLVCTVLAFYFIIKDKTKLFYVLCAFIYFIISWIFLDMVWQMSITSIIIIVIANAVSISENTYDVFKKYLIWAISFVVLNFVIKWFVLYFAINLTAQLDSIGICCFDLLAICLCCEVIYSSIKFKKNTPWENENIDVLNKLKEFSFYNKTSSIYQFNYYVTKNFRHSLSIPEINNYYLALQDYISKNKEELLKLPKEEFLSKIFSVYKSK